MKTSSVLLLIACGAGFGIALGTERLAGALAVTSSPAMQLPDAPHQPPQARPGEPVLIRPKPPRPPADFETGTRNTGALPRAFDAARARKDAQELAALADAIPGEVDQVSKNVLPKDLVQQLKRIQKLAKRLRGEIGQ